MSVTVYKCPQCGAGLQFDAQSQKMHCTFCRGTFERGAVQQIEEQKPGEKPPPEAAYSAPQWQPEAAQAEPALEQTEGEDVRVESYLCPDCGAQILADATTSATFCAFCHNPAIIRERLEGAFRPASLIPFSVTREQAQQQFQAALRKKPLLPRFFSSQAQMEKITGIYVPFWLYDCNAWGGIHAKASKSHSYTSGDYHVTQTSHYNVIREGSAAFLRIPADASSKLDDKTMDLLEPYDYSKLQKFDMAALSGFLAERYDRDAKTTFPRVQARVQAGMNQLLRGTIQGFTSYSVRDECFSIPHSRAQYALLPVWMMTVRYQGQFWLYAINGQTGRIVGKLPSSWGKAAAWFGGIAAGVFALLYLGGELLL